jgi:hypothetical protein
MHDCLHIAESGRWANSTQQQDSAATPLPRRPPSRIINPTQSETITKHLEVQKHIHHVQLLLVAPPVTSQTPLFFSLLAKTTNTQAASGQVYCLLKTTVHSTKQTRLSTRNHLDILSACSNRGCGLDVKI